jgi:hypothetical protein
LRVLQPLPKKMVPPTKAKCRNLCGRSSDALEEYVAQLRIGTLVGIENQHPRVLVADLEKSGIALCRIGIKHSLMHLRAPILGEFNRAICTKRIEYMHVVAPVHRIQAAGQVQLFILGDDQNRKHKAGTLLPLASLVLRSRVVYRSLFLTDAGRSLLNRRAWAGFARGFLHLNGIRLAGIALRPHLLCFKHDLPFVDGLQ